MSAKLKWLFPIVGAALMALTAVATAKDVTLSFYYPIAVGGPIPKIIDGYVADFEKENPGITIKAIYAGTYQDTLVKALTAFKSGEPPDIAVLLSTDMFTLDRRGRYRAVRRSVENRYRQSVGEIVLSCLHGEQPDRRQNLGHSVPALDHRDVLEQGRVQGGGA